MNLATVIELYAGGPGSGCNPEVGKCGRPAGAGQDVQKHIAAYQQMYPQVLQRFQQTVGGFGKVESRLKTADSLQEKLARKNTTLDQVKDVVGLRVTVPSMGDLTKAVAALKGQFDIQEEDNKINNPTGGIYRAYHLIANIDGKPVEMQVRTENQSRLANWMHDTVYKGALKNSQVALDYAKKLSDHFNQIDMGSKFSKMPECPPGFTNCFQ